MFEHPGYLIFAGVAVALALLFPTTKNIAKSDRQQYYFLQGITFIGALVGAKLSVVFGDFGWPMNSGPDWRLLLTSGRSITGALLLGFLAAEAAKPVMGYLLPPNDRFAALIPFSIGFGRMGCFLSGCCAGRPYQGWCAVRGHDGVMRHPTQIYELLFQFMIGGVFVFCVHRRWLFGRLFASYLVVYGIFRFCTEFLRDTPKHFWGLSGYQILAFLMILIGGAFLVRRTIAPPPAWAAFRVAAPGPT